MPLVCILEVVMRLNKMSVFLFAFVFVVLMFAQSVMAVETGHITPEEGKTIIQQKKDLVIIDMRDPHEYVTTHYPNAINIPVNELEARLSEVPAGRPILVHCVRGMRSKRGYEILVEQRPDIKELYHIDGAPIFD